MNALTVGKFAPVHGVGMIFQKVTNVKAAEIINLIIKIKMNKILKLQKLSDIILIANFVALLISILLNLALYKRVENVMIILSISFALSLFFYFIISAIATFKEN